jgi:uncharacterized protein (DUF2225 family)
MAVIEPLYRINVKCMNCEKEFKSSRVRSSFKKATKTDTDFCVHYNEVNPDYYVVRVCPFCGFSSTESFSENLGANHKKRFSEKIGNRWPMYDYCAERSWDAALQTYKLALVCAQVKEEKERVVAGLLHHIAWLYRYKENLQEETRFLEYALESYISVYENEGIDTSNARLMYLIGELNRRLSRYNEAIKWFSRVINDKKITDAAMIRACREQWAATREDMLAAKMELPEDFKESM